MSWADTVNSPRPNGVELICAASIPAEPIDWIWPNWLAAGKLHIIAGAPATGKTTMAICLAAPITNGGSNGCHWPDGSFVRSGNVVIWAGEDGIADTIIPRLEASGANLNRVFIVGQTNESGRTRPFDPATDLTMLDHEIRKIGNVALVIIDPIVMVVDGDSHKNSDVRKGLAPLVEMAEKYNCAVLGISHITKSSKGKDPLDRVVGSMGFTAVARIVLMVAAIKSDLPSDGPSRCVLVRAKTNIGPNLGGFMYHIEPVEFTTDMGLISSSRVSWDETPIEGSASEILKFAEGNGGGRGDRESGKLSVAEDFLKMILADGPVSYPDIQSQAFQAGISRGTLVRAKSELNVKSYKQSGAGSASPSMWFLSTVSSAKWQPGACRTSPFAPVAPFTSTASLASAAPFAPVGPFGPAAPHAAFASAMSTEQFAPVGPFASAASLASTEPFAPVGPFASVASVAQLAPVAQHAEVSRVGRGNDETGDDVDESLWNFFHKQCGQRIRSHHESRSASEGDDAFLESINKIVDEVVTHGFEYGSLSGKESTRAMYKRMLLDDTSWWHQG